MKRMMVIAGGAAALLLAGTAAWAGYKMSSEVTVDTTSRFATGSLGSARNSADSDQWIECSVDAYPTGLTTSVVCSAMDAEFDYASCFSDDPNLVAAATGISGDSQITFYWDTSGECIYLRAGNSSYYEPKAP